MNKLFNENTVFGFKAFDLDPDGGISCRGREYHPGTISIESGAPRCCHNGFHFCENIEDLKNFYNIASCYVVVYPVAAVGAIDKDYQKSATNMLYIFEKPLEDQVKQSFSGLYSNKTLRFYYEGFEYIYPFNQCDIYMFEQHPNDIIEYGSFKVKLSEIVRFFDLLHGMTTEERKLAVKYFDITGKYRSARKFIDVYENDRIVFMNQNEVKRIIDNAPLKMGKKAIKKHRVFYENFGLYEYSDNFWYYIEELNRY